VTTLGGLGLVVCLFCVSGSGSMRSQVTCVPSDSRSSEVVGSLYTFKWSCNVRSLLSSILVDLAKRFVKDLN
jgi:hypothetical protein